MEHYDFLKEYPDAPWEVGVCDESGVDTKAYVFAKREYPKSFCVAEVREKYIGHALPTAQRIVACVNACAGIPSDTLECVDIARALEALQWIFDGIAAGEDLDGPKVMHGLAEATMAIKGDE